jgi:hypothetical protein
MRLFLVRVDFFILIRNPLLLKADPCTLHERTELHSLKPSIGKSIHANTHPSSIEHEILWLLVFLDRFLCLTGCMWKYLFVWYGHDTVVTALEQDVSTNVQEYLDCIIPAIASSYWDFSQE